MAKVSTKTAAKADTPIFTPTPEAKAQATRSRIIALVLWAVAIALELVAIFWVMRPSFDELAASQGFPQWRWYTLLGFIAVIGVLAIVGSVLWKKANHLDPASNKQPVKFFIQNQLGAFIALLAFLPLIVMIFLNKDMDAKQKNIAGAAGIIVAIAATVLGIDFKPLSQEQAAVESQVVTHLVGQDLVWWTAGGKVVHLCQDASDIRNATTTVESGPIADAFGKGKEGITLLLDRELNQCGLPVPGNLAEIEQWVRTARGL
jgi:NAD/NADP transhydrogenase beta subunit